MAILQVDGRDGWLVAMMLSASGHPVQRVGIPHSGRAYSRPLLSVTYKHDNFGNRVAYLRCVVQDGSSLFDEDVKEKL